MSYDLLLLRLEPGDDPDEALERLEASAESAPDEAARRRMQDAAAAVQTRFPQLDRNDDDTSIELTSLDESKPYQVSLFANQGGANVPYWHDDERAEATYGELFAVLGVVCERTGWSIYDPQLERELDPDHDLGTVLEAHGEGVGYTRQIEARYDRPRGFLRRLLGRPR